MDWLLQVSPYSLGSREHLLLIVCKTKNLNAREICCIDKYNQLENPCMIKEGVESSVHADMSLLVRILTQILMPCTMGIFDKD